MNTFTETSAALGIPLSLRKVGPAAHPRALIARWKHGDAFVESTAGDSLRVLLSLRGGHSVLQKDEIHAPKAIVAGNVGVLAGDRSLAMQIEGQADIVQIFIDRGCFGSAAGADVVSMPTPDWPDDELQAAAVQLFVTSHVGARHDDLQLEASLNRIVRCLMGRQPTASQKRPGGGISHGAMRRVQALIACRLDAAEMQSPSIKELASAAGMGVSHFIRAFRQSTGATPHQHVMSCRIERAIDLLARPDCSVAEVSDSAGYSSPSHFVASFRDRFGVTPGAYREAVFI
jgi:AraC family transcriptional regulator